ncbi:MAG TPA: HNH/endonuclease VII fold toxin-2 domain-containing protein [Ignavibacteriales bacterium]|nr:HNH/endonuclease VII fold toxin-2 domain-containing protein [Ignavibacteriales bacterium]
MSNQVYANNREIACKAANGKAICSFPDVCFTPPQTPATPPGVPVPYPNTGMASDATSGSKNVRISGKEVMLKNKSYFKSSTGDEAGCAPKKGVVSSQNRGKVYFEAWSMDVKIEGENVVRHMDLTTHNHASPIGNTPVWMYIDEMAIDNPKNPCASDIKKEKKACKEYTPHGDKDPCTKTNLGISGKPSGATTSPEADKLADRTAANKCLAARRCALQPYKSAKSSCCHQQTGHHLIEASALHASGRGGSGSIPLQGIKNYNENMAPCVCAEGKNQNTGTHGLMHAFQSASASKAKPGAIKLKGGRTITEKRTTYGKAKKQSVKAMKKTFPESNCKEKCIQAQLDHYHKDCGLENDTPIKAVKTGKITESDANAAVKARSKRVSAAANQGGRFSRS